MMNKLFCVLILGLSLKAVGSGDSENLAPIVGDHLLKGCVVFGELPQDQLKDRSVFGELPQNRRDKVLCPLKPSHGKRDSVMVEGLKQTHLPKSTNIKKLSKREKFALAIKHMESFLSPTARRAAAKYVLNHSKDRRTRDKAKEIIKASFEKHFPEMGEIIL